MRKKTVVRAIKSYRSAQTTLLRVFSVNENGGETWVATSSPIHKVAATEICRVFEQPITIVPPAESLREILKIPGRAAWASATASDAHAATVQACLQHDIKTALGVLVMVTLSFDCSIVENLKVVLNVTQQETPLAKKRALLVGFDEQVSGRVRVDVLAVGLRGWHV